MNMQELVSIPKQAFQGSFSMPHVGTHPGIIVFFGLVVATAIAGVQRGGALGMALAAGLIIAVYLPLLLFGSVCRARLSDRTTREKKLAKLLQAWIDVQVCAPQDKGFTFAIQWIPSCGPTPYRLQIHSRDGLQAEIPANVINKAQDILSAPISAVGRSYTPPIGEINSMLLYRKSLSSHDRIKAHTYLKNLGTVT